MKNPGCMAYLIRKSHPQLEANHILPLKRELPKELGNYNETKKRFDWWNGSTLQFRHCEYDRDLHDFQGWECHWLGIDEASQLNEEHIKYMKTRVRLGSWKPADPAAIKRLPRCVMTSNPGGPSHHYLKELFIDAGPPEIVFYDSMMKNPKNPEHKGWSSIFIRHEWTITSIWMTTTRDNSANCLNGKPSSFVTATGMLYRARSSIVGPKTMLLSRLQSRLTGQNSDPVTGLCNPFSIGEWVVSDAQK